MDDTPVVKTLLSHVKADQRACTAGEAPKQQTEKKAQFETSAGVSDKSPQSRTARNSSRQRHETALIGPAVFRPHRSEPTNKAAATEALPT